MRLLGVLVAALAMGISGSALAQPDHGGPPGMHAPPQAAFDACASLKAGDACSVTLDGHTMDGTCRNGPDGKGALACAPKGMPPPHGHHGPPPAAFDACASLRDGDTCSFTMEGQAVNGSCRTGPDGKGALACAPKNMPPPPPPPQAAIDACATLRDGDTCSFTMDGQTINGACHSCHDGNKPMACAPKDMPPPPPPPAR